MSETVKVRVAVAVDEHGRWTAWGGRQIPDKQLMEQATYGLTGAVAEFFLTAELPIPTAIEVAAQVEDGR